MEEDLQRLGVGGEHDELGLAAVEGLGGLVGTLAQLLVVDGLLDQVEDLGAVGRFTALEKGKIGCGLFCSLV